MDWASAIFPFENRVEPSRFVRRIWRTRSVPAPQFISVAVPYWEIVIACHADGQREIFARGPETAASMADIPPDTEFFGIQFELGVHMPQMPLPALVDGATQLPLLSPRDFHLDGTSWAIPDFENADTFAARLAAAGVITRDPLIEEVLLRKPLQLSDRSIQRRFLRSTGLTYGAVRQIERAERAAALLESGKGILDVAEDLGFSDQAHLTRALRRYLGRTPGRILGGKV